MNEKLNDRIWADRLVAQVVICELRRPQRPAALCKGQHNYQREFQSINQSINQSIHQLFN